MKTCQDVCPGRESSRALPECKSRALLLDQPVRSISILSVSLSTECIVTCFGRGSDW
jgi:hypothetical protein